MFLVVTGNFDKDEILEAIKENQSKKNHKEIPIIEEKNYKEPDKIVNISDLTEAIIRIIPIRSSLITSFTIPNIVYIPPMFYLHISPM